MRDSDHPWWRKFFSKSWHNTLRQSVENPLQFDRLPTDVAPEFDYPVFSESFAASQWRTFKAALFILVLTIPIALLIWWVPVVSLVLLPFGFVYCVAYLAFHLTPSLNLLPRAAIAFAGMFFAMFLMSSLPLTLAALLAGTIGLLVLADSLAGHGTSLATAAPTPRETAVGIRRLWSQRFTALQRPLRGAEGYLLGIGLLLVLCDFWVRFWRTPERPRDPASLLESLLLPAALAIGATLLLEMGLAFLYGRSSASLFTLAKAAWRGFVDWHCYNFQQTHALGVHSTRAGPAPGRRRLLCVVFILWLIVFFSLESQSVLAPRRVRETQPVTLEADRSTPIVNQSSGDRLRTAKPSVGPNADAKTPVVLTRVEQHYLDQLSPQDREKYLQKRSDQSRPAPPVAAKLSPSTESGFPNADGSAPAVDLFNYPWYSYLFAFARVVTEIIFFWLKLGLLSTAFIATGVFVTSARVLAAWDRGPNRERVFNTANWDHLVARLQNSHDPTEQNSLLMGTNAHDDTPILVPRDVFCEHAHILGDSGSGKTSQGIMPLMTQLLRRGDCSVIVIDLKADDQAVIETMRLEAANVDQRCKSADPQHPGFPCRWFTTELGRSTYAFNPLRQKFFTKLPDNQRTDVLTAALGLQYGTDYGRKFFGDANYELLQFTVQNYPTADSFTALADVLAGSGRFPLDPETKRASTNTKSAVRRLSRCQPLNASPDNQTPPAVLDAAIDFEQVFSQPQAVYFALPSATGVGTSAEIARLALYSLLAAAQSHTGPRVQTFVFIDEFQRIVSHNLELLLQTARSMNIGLILSNQSAADLDTVDTNLLPAVRANTRWRQNFSVSEPGEIEAIRDASGETLINPAVMSFLPGLLWGYWRNSMAISEATSPRLRINDILLAGDAPSRSIVTLRRSAGFAQFGGLSFIMDSVYHITREVYQRRFQAPWPERNSGTMFPTLADQNPRPTTRAQVLAPFTIPDPMAQPSAPDGDGCPETVEHSAGTNNAPVESLGDAPGKTPAPNDGVSTEPNTPENGETPVDAESDFLERLRDEQWQADQVRRKKKKKDSKRKHPKPSTDPSEPPGESP